MKYSHFTHGMLSNVARGAGAVLFGVLGATLVTACAVETSTESGETAEVAIQAQSQVLNTLSVEGEEISFVAYDAGDGSPRAIMIEGTHSNMTESVFSGLARQAGKLTTLEKFKALAPADAVPHQLLVDAHAGQAVSLGRTDASVRQIQFDPSLVLKYSTPTACRNAALGGATPNDSFTSAWFETAGTVCTNDCDWTGDDMKVWACVADGSVGITYAYWRDYEHTTWKSSGQYAIPKSGIRYWSWDGSIVPLKMMKITVGGMNNNPHSIGWAIGFF